MIPQGMRSRQHLKANDKVFAVETPQGILPTQPHASSRYTKRRTDTLSVRRYTIAPPGFEPGTF